MSYEAAKTYVGISCKDWLHYSGKASALAKKSTTNAMGLAAKGVGNVAGVVSSGATG